MASFRKLPSGKWQGSVSLPDGRRITKTAPLKGTVQAWASEEERKLRRGEWVDPRTARLTVGDWIDTWSAARVVEEKTAAVDRAGIERIRARFGHRPLGAVTRLEVQAWVRNLVDDGVGPHAVTRAYRTLVTAYRAAVDEDIVVRSPCRRISLPPTPPKQPAWFTPEEVERLVSELPEPHATMTLLMTMTGMRWGEAAGLRLEDVDWLRRRVRVVGAMSQEGKWKAYPKTESSRRELGVPAWLLERMSRLAAGGDLYVFRSSRLGRPLRGAPWRKVWNEAITRAGVPRHTPHTCRHTAASWAVQKGASLYEVQEFLGHTDHATTQRYAHLDSDVAGRMERLLDTGAHGVRTGRETGG